MEKGAEIVTRDEVNTFLKLYYKLCSKIHEVTSFVKYIGFDIGVISSIDRSYSNPDEALVVSVEGHDTKYHIPIRMLGMTLEELEEEQADEERQAEMKRQRRKAARLRKAEEWDRKTYERLKKKFEPEKKT